MVSAFYLRRLILHDSRKPLLYSSVTSSGGTGELFCPDASGAPTTVTTGWYSTPLSVPVTVRTGQAPCPANRACSGGLILPGVDWSATCPGGSVFFSGSEVLPNATFGPVLLPSTPGYSGSLVWTTNVSYLDVSCAAVVRVNATAGLMLAGATGVPFASCPSGVVVTLVATRSNDPTLNASCAVTYSLGQVPRAPVITSCAGGTIAERQPVNSVVPGATLNATVNNIGTTIFYQIIGSGAPFSVGVRNLSCLRRGVLCYSNKHSMSPPAVQACDGIIRTTQILSAAQQSTYTVSVSASNVGLLPLMVSNCTFVVNVTRAPLPPTLNVTSFTIPELTANGTVVGDVRAYDPNTGGNITSVTFVSLDCLATAVCNIFLILSASAFHRVWWTRQITSHSRRVE